MSTSEDAVRYQMGELATRYAPVDQWVWQPGYDRQPSPWGPNYYTPRSKVVGLFLCVRREGWPYAKSQAYVPQEQLPRIVAVALSAIDSPVQRLRIVREAARREGYELTEVPADAR